MGFSRVEEDKTFAEISLLLLGGILYTFQPSHLNNNIVSYYQRKLRTKIHLNIQNDILYKCFIFKLIPFLMQ